MKRRRESCELGTEPPASEPCSVGATTDRPPRIRAAPADRRVAALILAATVALAACSAGGINGDANPGMDGAGQSDTDTTDPGGPTTTDPGGPATSVPAATARCAPATNETGTESATTVRIWHGLDGDVELFFDDVITMFESEHPDITVEVTRFEGSYTEGTAQLAALDPDDRPDVFMGSNSSIRLQYDSGLEVGWSSRQSRRRAAYWSIGGTAGRALRAPMSCSTIRNRSPRSSGSGCCIARATCSGRG